MGSRVPNEGEGSSGGGGGGGGSRLPFDPSLVNAENGMADYAEGVVT